MPVTLAFLHTVEPADFDAAATLAAIAAQPVPLRAAEDVDADAVRRFLYLRALVAAAEAELAPLKDRVTALVASEPEGAATFRDGSTLCVTWRRTYDYPPEVEELADELKRLKRYHERPDNLQHETAVLTLKAPRRPR